MLASVKATSSNASASERRRSSGAAEGAVAGAVAAAVALRAVAAVVVAAIVTRKRKCREYKQTMAEALDAGEDEETAKQMARNAYVACD